MCEWVGVWEGNQARAEHNQIRAGAVGTACTSTAFHRVVEESARRTWSSLRNTADDICGGRKTTTLLDK